MDILALVRQYETGGGTNPAGANVLNYRYDATHTASGYYQITNTNWNAYAPGQGIDTNQYPTAISAPYDAQTSVANYLLTSTPQGVGNWSNYNPQLASALNTADTGSGMTGTGTVGPGERYTGQSGSWNSGIPDTPYPSGNDPLAGVPGTGQPGGGSNLDPNSGQSNPTNMTPSTGSSDWVTEITGWLSALASRGALFVIGAILVIGAVAMFAKHEAT